MFGKKLFVSSQYYIRVILSVGKAYTLKEVLCNGAVLSNHWEQGSRNQVNSQYRQSTYCPVHFLTIRPAAAYNKIWGKRKRL